MGAAYANWDMEQKSLNASGWDQAELGLKTWEAQFKYTPKVWCLLKGHGPLCLWERKLNDWPTFQPGKMLPHDSKSLGNTKWWHLPLKLVAGEDINHIYICIYTPLLPKITQGCFSHLAHWGGWLQGFNLPPAKQEAEEKHWNNLTQDANILDEAGALPTWDRSVVFILSRSFLLYYSWVYFTVDGPVWFP